MEDFTTQDWIILVLVVFVILAAIWWKLRGDIIFLFSKNQADGYIINWMKATQGGKQVFIPLIEFTTNDGRKITFKADETCEGQPMYEVGTKVLIKYLPSDPEIRKVVYP